MDTQFEEQPPKEESPVWRLGRPWDPRAALAVITVLCAMLIQGAIILGYAVTGEMPNWVVALVSSVTAYYFGAKNGTGYRK